MKKFLVLLTKEVKELITPQVILPLVLTVVFFMLIGNILGKEQKKVETTAQPIVVIDHDQTATSHTITDILSKANFKVERHENSTVEQGIKLANTSKSSALLVIPQGFEQGIRTLNPLPIDSYNFIRSFSIVGTRNYTVLQAAFTALNEYFSNQLITTNSSITKIENVKNPIKTKDHVIIRERRAEANLQEVIAFVSTQTTFIPIILFFVIVFAAQMIATTIATEKENKTLETLLSLPIDRRYIVVAKMLAGAFIALLGSVLYMFGFRSYMNGITGNAFVNLGGGVNEAITKLGLSLSVGDYFLLGLSLFCGILAALSIALIIGAFAEDVKSLQGLIAPFMILVTIPYLLTLFIDLETASPAIKYLVYAIPFSHSFLAAPNLFLHNYTQLGLGILYQFVVFIIFTLIASRIFSTDHIITMKLSFSRKKRLV